MPSTTDANLTADTLAELGKTQRRALAALASASRDCISIANDIRHEMFDLTSQIEQGLHASRASHQRPFDLQEAIARRQLAAEFATTAGCTRSDISEASKGLGA